MRTAASVSLMDVDDVDGVGADGRTTVLESESLRFFRDGRFELDDLSHDLTTTPL